MVIAAKPAKRPVGRPPAGERVTLSLRVPIALAARIEAMAGPGSTNAKLVALIERGLPNET